MVFYKNTAEPRFQEVDSHQIHIPYFDWNSLYKANKNSMKLKLEKNIRPEKLKTLDKNLNFPILSVYANEENKNKRCLIMLCEDHTANVWLDVTEQDYFELPTVEVSRETAIELSTFNKGYFNPNEDDKPERKENGS